ncbi:carbohydrate ABC transporter permease [Kribbella sp. NBC_00482]|uniref:carbohydrate ABC transporter permease n=1 Tax=Kribbella sp. NBC_00482 TaxID=2975968 RepID=UPI002E19D514
MSLFPKVGRKQPGVRLSRGAVIGFLGLGVLLHLLPFYFMIVTSLKPASEVLAFPPSLWPHDFNTSAWKLVVGIASGSAKVSALMDEPFIVYFLNSIFITIVAVGIGMPVTSLAAYANSKLQRGRGARFSFLFFIGTMMVPFIVTLIPTYLLTLNFPFPLPQVPSIPGTDLEFPSVRIWDTPWAVIVPAIYVPFSFLLFKGFFDTIPDSVINAARVDGGSELNIFRRIVVPMAIPVYAVAAYLNFGSVWDNFLWQLVVLQSPEKLTTSVAIYQLMDKFTQAGATNGEQANAQSDAMREVLAAGLSWNGLMVLGLLQTLPVFIAFIVCRRYILRGVRIRGLK